MASNNFANQNNIQALTAKRVQNVTGYSYINPNIPLTIATDVTVPYDVNFNTPRYGNQICGGIKIETTPDNDYINLYIVLAGASSPTLFTVKAGDFLDVQAISILNPNISGVSIIAYMGQSAENTFEPFYNPYYQPYYNYDVVAAWGSEAGVSTPMTQGEFETYLTSKGYDLTGTIINNYTFEQIYNSSSGENVGRIKCRLLLNCKSNNYRFNSNFLEINGVGDFFDAPQVTINNNNLVIQDDVQQFSCRGLKKINFNYWSQYEGPGSSFYAYDNHYLEYVNLDFMVYETQRNTLTDFEMGGCYNLEKFDNFQMPNSLTYFSVYNMYGMKEFNYDLTNTSVTTFYCTDSYGYLNDGVTRTGIEYVNLGLLPNTVSYVGINGNNLKTMTAGYSKFPNNLNTLAANENGMVDFNPSGKLPDSINTLYIHNNELTSFDLNYELPNNLLFFNLSYNKINSFTTYTKNVIVLYLNNNQLTSFSFDKYLNNSVNNLFINNNALNSIVSSKPIPTSLNYLGANNNYITSVLLQGTNGPSTINLQNNLMTTAAWSAMNTWATGITAAAPNSKFFYANNNINPIDPSAVYATLVAKGYQVTI